ncbi:MAG: alpha/beta hydrolase [Geitlerinemataceae cyanobacterium]
MIGSSSLNVRVLGTGKPLLCLHGHPGSGESMSVFTQSLSRRFRTIAPDLRGYGRTPVQEEFEMIDHLDDLEALLEQLEIDRFWLLGWSLGGILSIELALRFPQRVEGLILVATAAHPRSNHPPITWQDLAYTGVAGILNAWQPGWKWNIETFGKRSLFQHLIQQHTPETYQYLATEGVSAYLQTTAVARRALEKAIRGGYNRLPELETIQCPCLVLAGERDRHITPEASRETAQNLPNSQWQCYPNTAHLFPWEIPDRVLQDIDRWLDTIID